ncbi:g8362 [Coccomyxa elongata]
MGDAQLQQWFNAVDLDRSGAISSGELQQALGYGGMNFSLKVCAALIRLHDRDNSGTISFTEFRTLNQFIMSLQQKFQQYDTSRKGRIEKKGVEQLLQNMGYRLDGPAFDALFSAYDPDRSGSTDMAELVAMTVFLQGAIATFQAFDVQRQGRITLDYNQFVYAASSVG